MPTFWPANTPLKLILRSPMQIRPHCVTVMVRVEGVFDLAQAGIGPRRRAAELSRVFHVQRLMRPLVVEALNEVIELRLLLEEVFRRRLGGFLLQG